MDKKSKEYKEAFRKGRVYQLIQDLKELGTGKGKTPPERDPEKKWLDRLR